MSQFDSFNLSDYETIVDLEELLNAIDDELSTLRGYQRGAKEKLRAIDAEEMRNES